MSSKAKYLEALMVVKAYESDLGLYNMGGSLPFEEYHEFHKWMKNEGWYEAADMEYDNLNDPNSCIRLDIKELYLEYVANKNNKK